MKLSEEKALFRAAAYCSKAERCEFDVRRKLVGWELTDEEQDRILKRLKEEKYIDNSRYARSFINDKIKYNKWGVNKIVFELKKKRVEEKYYSQILNDLSKEEFEPQLISILKTKNRSVKAKDIYDRKNKLIRFALGRGFSMDLVVKCVEGLISGEYDEEDN